MPTNDDHNPNAPRDIEHPGYETTDANVGGVVVFLGGLFGFLLVFFVFCFVLGKVINSALEKSDGPADKWHQGPNSIGIAPDGKREDLTSNPQMQQREYQQMTADFPSPRLQPDDGNQETADLHAREDLLLNHYSVSPSEGGEIRIPITQAMALIAQRGLPVNAQAQGQASSHEMAGDPAPMVTLPLTTGFARTGYELDAIEARAQKMNYGKATAANEHAELAPAH